mmetsp:Transcript_25174/g.58181  ORF Transcript_25174/g.58181 Transcript_25174/m.58181 type:complete len:150 (-) Transcript_25174:26-475(-)
MGLSQSILDLTPMQVKEVYSWRQFYEDSEKYKFVGLLIGIYYDSDGNPTDVFAEIEEMLSLADEHQEIEKQLKREYPTCALRSRSEYTEYWCEHSQKVPRKMKSYIMDNGQRCGCFTISDAKLKEEEFELEIYDNCITANKCIIYKNSK